jgi:hypothetical protein
VGLRRLSLAYSNAEHPGHIYDLTHFLIGIFWIATAEKNKLLHMRAPTSEWWKGRWGTGRKSNVAIENPPVHPFRSMLATKTNGSLDWFKGKFTGNHGFYMFLPSNIGVSCKFSHHPIL